MSVRRSKFAAACAVLLLLPLSSFAALQNSVSLTITPTDAGGTGPFTQTLTGTGPLDISSTTATGGLSSSGTGASHVEYGGIHLTGTTAGSIDLTATGAYQDTFTINALDPNTSQPITAGTPGTMTFRIEVDGSITADTGDSLASWELDVGVASRALSKLAAGGQQSPDSPRNPPGIDPLGFEYSATVSFQFGVPMTLDVELTGTASSRLGPTNEPGDAAFDLSPWVYWAGIDPILVNGNEVESPTVTSDSGTNWIEAFNPPAEVPEPGTLGMLAVGGMFVQRRMRTRAVLRRR